jgi:hypothetical protein
MPEKQHAVGETSAEVRKARAKKEGMGKVGVQRKRQKKMTHPEQPPQVLLRDIALALLVVAIERIYGVVSSVDKV